MKTSVKSVLFALGAAGLSAANFTPSSIGGPVPAIGGSLNAGATYIDRPTVGDLRNAPFIRDLPIIGN